MYYFNMQKHNISMICCIFEIVDKWKRGKWWGTYVQICCEVLFLLSFRELMLWLKTLRTAYKHRRTYKKHRRYPKHNRDIRTIYIRVEIGAPAKSEKTLVLCYTRFSYVLIF